MKKITILLSLAFLFVLSNSLNAQCPGANTFSLTAQDTVNYYNNGATNVNNVGANVNCNAIPFYMYVTEQGSGQDVHQPCIKTDYFLYQNWEGTRITENLYEGGVYNACIGPGVGCAFPVGGGTALPNSQWDLIWYGLDATQTHMFPFSKTPNTATATSVTITVSDCWSGVAGFPTPALAGTTGPNPQTWTGNSAPSTYTVNVPANSNIGSAVYTINPAAPPQAFISYGFGYCYVNPQLLTPGTTYTVTYTFTPPASSGCPAVTKNKVFAINNPYTSTWSAPGPLCDNGACVSLTTSGTAGGTWSGTGVSGTQFCPATSGAGSFPVTYSVGINATCGSSTSHNVNVNAAPVMSAVATPTAICIGQSALLTANGGTSWAWSANAGSVTTQTATVNPGTTTTYTVIGTTAGCSNPAQVTVTVNPLPTVTAVATPTAICSGASASLNASGASTYTWSLNEGGTSNNPTSVSPTTTDTYTVTGTDANGCANTGQVTVTVNPTPTVVTTPSSATICAGAAATCTVSGATTYTWSANAGSVNTPAISVNPANTTTYTVTGDNAGCTATATFVVNVNPLPVLTVTANPTSVCTGQTSTLTAGGAASYTWSANAGGVVASTTTVSPGASTTYTVVGELSGCLDSTTITVNMGAQPVLSISATDTTICAGQTTTLTAAGATNYTWSPGGPGTSISQSPNATTTYTLIGSNSGCADTINFVINVNPTPTVTAVASPTAICSGATSTLTASGATTYTWSANAGGGTGTTAAVTPANTTTYNVTGTDNNGCTGTAQVTVSVTPTPTLIALANPTVVCSGQQVGLVANGTATTYSWSTGATGQITQDIPTVSTTYTVTGFTGTCSSFTTVSVVVVTQPTLTIAPTATAICSGASVTLSATVAPGSATISWQPGGASTTTLVVTPVSTQTYTATASNGTCTDVKTSVVTVNPTPTLQPVASQTNVCSGSNVNAINFVVGSGTVSWTNSNTNIGLPANGTTNPIPGYQAPVVATQQTGIITATPTDAVTGCSGTSQTFTIIINPVPVITGPAVIDSAKCGMPTGDIKNLAVSNGTPAYTYQWTLSGLPVPGATTLNLNNVPMGTYSLAVTDANGCKAGSGPYVVPGTPMVVASFTPSPWFGAAPLNVAFTNGSVGANAYNWNFGNGTNSTGTNPNTSYPVGGDYLVILTATNGSCSSTDTALIHVDQEIKITIPNIFSPNADNINDEFMFSCTGITSLTCDIFNRWGQKVKTLTGPTAKWDGKLDNGNAASEGTYFYTLIATSYDGKPHNSQGSLTLVK